MTQSNALSNQLSTHDAGIKSLLNNRGCVKSVQRIVKGNFKIDYQDHMGPIIHSMSIPISAINLSKSILLVNNCVLEPIRTKPTTEACGFVKCTLQSSSILLEATNDIAASTNIELFEAQVIEFY